jgi:hypothetical protein
MSLSRAGSAREGCYQGLAGAADRAAVRALRGQAATVVENP